MKNNMNESVLRARKFSPFLLVIIVITLMLSLASIYQGIQYYLSEESEIWSIYISIGMVTLVISGYMLLQMRRQVIKLASMKPTILKTTVQCQKCGFRNIRDFQRGDFVFKVETEQTCPKCTEKKLLISSIYREVKEKKTKESRYS